MCRFVSALLNKPTKPASRLFPWCAMTTSRSCRLLQTSAGFRIAQLLAWLILIQILSLINAWPQFAPDYPNTPYSRAPARSISQQMYSIKGEFRHISGSDITCSAISFIRDANHLMTPNSTFYMYIYLFNYKCSSSGSGVWSRVQKCSF